MHPRLLALAGAGALLIAGVAAPAHAAQNTQLSVLHAVPGLTVDVYVNGKLTLDNFKPGSLAGPLKLKAGTYTGAITAGNAKNDSKPAIGPVDLKLSSDHSYTAVAHLDKGGAPTATLFDNDISKTKAGDGRLTVRHVAAAPAVDILAGGKAAISGLSNPKEEVLELPAGTIPAAVAAAGTTKPLIGPADVKVAEGKNTIVYAWGSLKDKNLKLAVQTLGGLNSHPSGVDAGEAGLAADQGSAPLAAGVMGLVLIGGVLLARRRLVSVRAPR
jgi:hypothetical protein